MYIFAEARFKGAPEELRCSASWEWDCMSNRGTERKIVQKAILVKPKEKPGSDLGDVLKLGRDVGKKVLKTDEDPRVLWVHESPYGYVVIIEGCTEPSGCKMEETEKEI